MRLGAVIADTLPDKRTARLAVERTLRELPIRDCLVVSDTCFVDGARHVRIAPLDGLAAYNALMLDGLADHLECDAYLVVQWDGFVIDGRRWQREFLEHDYIGAPWLHRGGAVGAGGFSLRSRRLIEAVRDLRRLRARRDIDTAEDLQICVTYRGALDARGLRIAPVDVAARFAFERTPDPIAAPRRSTPETLGFHGVFNLPLVLAEHEILGLLDSIIPRIPASWVVWYLFVLHAWQRRYEALGIRLLSALAGRSGLLWARVAQACVRRGVPPRWLTAAA
jgi:hypothetical protein